MSSKIRIEIETDDTDLVERIGRAMNGNMTETVEGSHCKPPCDDQGRPAHYAEGPDHEDGPGFDGWGERAGVDEQPGESDRPAATADETTHAASDAPRDQNGVAFDANYCGQAKEPFYASGKRSGQWKKKKGVSDDDYDAWYASQVAAGGSSEQDHQPVNTAGAFGGQSQQQTAPDAPTDAGAFMGWVAEKQAAGLLNQTDINEAYQHAQVQVQDLFPPNDANSVAQRIAALYNVLAAKAGA